MDPTHVRPDGDAPFAASPYSGLLPLPAVRRMVHTARRCVGCLAWQNALARRIVLGATAAMLIVYAVTLWRIEPFWHDDIAIARGYIEGYPESTAWHWNLATKLDQEGDLVGAEQEIRTALRLEPDRTGNIFHPHSDELHHSLGELLARRGDIEGAE